MLDQVFGQLGCCLQPDLSYVEHSKDIMSEMSMDLDDFNFDFDTISESLGPWIQPNDLKIDITDLKDDLNFKSESIDFEDLEITEAVRYDCMWSSNPSPSIEKKKPHSLCENSLFEEFLKIIDNPSQFDLDIDIKPEQEEEEKEQKPDVSSTSDITPTDLHSQARMFTSLDHCYVSSTRPDKHTYSSNFLVTPPESSEDEETQSVLPFPHVINPTSPTCVRSQSLLKRSRSGGEAKFCFRVKLKSDKSRSVLKPHLGSSSVKRSSSGIMNKNMVQTSIRRRKEESLKVKHHEAREIHNHMERQRRNELKVSFDELKACIPNIAKSEKVSKQMILDTALENCKLLKSREISLKIRRDKMKKSNAELLLKLKLLQSQRGH